MAVPEGGIMIYLITDSGVKVGRTVCDINKKYNIMVEQAELYPYGPDMVAKLTRADIDFVQDKRRMSAIMFGNFFKTDNSGKLLTIVNLILTCVLLFTSCGATG